MLKIKGILFLCFIALQSFSQDVINPGGNNREAIIEYKFTASKAGYEMTRAGTLLVRNSFVLEPILVDSTLDETTISTSVTKSIASVQKLKWYYLTDISKMIGMGFNIEKQPTRENIKTFTSKSKDLGYGLSVEPFLFENGYSINDYSKHNDTVFNGQKCFVIKASKKTQVSNNSSEGELLFTKIVINPGIKGQSYPFISDTLARRFDGAIVFAESCFHSGLCITIEYEYKTELTSAYSKVFDKYQSLYFSNAMLLDQLKK